MLHLVSELSSKLKKEKREKLASSYINIYSQQKEKTMIQISSMIFEKNHDTDFFHDLWKN